MPTNGENKSNEQCLTICEADDKSLSREVHVKVESNSNIVSGHDFKRMQMEKRLNDLLPPLENPAITTLAHLVSESADLQKLLSLGVSMRKIERFPGAPDLIASLDFDQQVIGHVSMLRDLGVTNIGDVINRCPYILGKPLDVLRNRIFYLSSRRFQKEQIIDIMMKCPKWFMEKVDTIDGKLGAFQKLFNLNGSQLRSVASRCPKLILWDPVSVMKSRFILKELYTFSIADVQTIIVRSPNIFLTSELHLKNRLDYVLNTMEIDKDQLINWPQILRTREQKMKERHQLLHYLKLDQYNPREPGYVSLKSLVEGSDEHFCTDVAKISLTQYYDYLKTL